MSSDLLASAESRRLKEKSYHCVLIIDLNDNDRGVVSELAGFSKQLHVLKDQQLVPRGAQSLRQNLGTKPAT